jgi:hypothetical protein
VQLNWRRLLKPGKRDVGDAQVCVVEQAASEVRSARPRELIGGKTEVLKKQSAQVPGGQAEPCAEIRFAAVVERAADDQLNRTADKLRCRPRHRAADAVRTTAQARAVARGLGGSRHLERLHVVRPRARTATWTAVDAGGADCGELHVSRLRSGTEGGWPDSDMIIAVSVRVRPEVAPGSAKSGTRQIHQRRRTRSDVDQGVSHPAEGLQAGRTEAIVEEFAPVGP